ncbi:MAG: SDR family oxidoreductase [Leptospiraceae bacterium]|nr:SDR family oxidoreductase [Leptospiraceae bacterium]
MKHSYKKRVAVVTGAAGGIGKELCYGITKREGTVLALDRDEEGLKVLKEGAGTSKEKIFTYKLDITSYEDVKKTYEKIKEEHRTIDFLFNNAGAVHRSSFLKTDVSVFHRVMNVNLWGSVYMSQIFLPDLIQTKGAIAITSSVAGFAPLYGRSFYCASKFALHGAFESIRSELKDYGVDVCIVSPGFTKTGFEKAALGTDGNLLKRERTSVGKYDTPENVAGQILSAVEKGKKFTVLTSVGKLSLFLRKIFPGLYDIMMYRSLHSELENE